MSQGCSEKPLYLIIIGTPLSDMWHIGCVQQGSVEACKEIIDREDGELEGKNSQYKPVSAGNMEKASLVVECIMVVPDLLNSMTFSA